MFTASDFHLLTLRIMIAPRRDSGTEVLFQVGGGHSDPRDVVRCSLSDLGLPTTLEGLEPVNDEFKIPDRVVSKLGKALDRFQFSPDVCVPDGTEVWLEFPNPRGALYVMPWERLLRPLERQLLRVPYHAVRPPPAGGALRVAICATTPMAKTQFDVATVLEQIVRQYEDATVRTLLLHVFTDQGSHSLVANRLRTGGRHVIVHDPAGAEEYRPPPRSTQISMTAKLSNPWLLWMRDATEGQPLDVVHVVSHGYMSGDQGAIAMAVSPTRNSDAQLSRFIGAIELNTFLTQVGAWGLVLSGPEENYSEAGQREVADAIAQVRPGFAVMHDFSRDEQCLQLGTLLGSVLDSPRSFDPLDAMTCWVHPNPIFHGRKYGDALYLDSHGSSAFIGPSTRKALADYETQSWVASAARTLEAQQSRLLPDTADEPVDEAAVIALRNAADLVERNVVLAYGTVYEQQQAPHDELSW
jgi:hypothetical protein